MQYVVYRTKGKNPDFPLMVDITSDIIGRINRRLVIPLMPSERLNGSPIPKRLTPVLLLNGAEYVLMTHEAATVPHTALGEEFCNASYCKGAIKSAFNFLTDGID
ncbi:CcdB family protein [Pantoea dispersa]|uniref:CcdB family protein n=1 Tax=Pantoea dispersa TaxID=59814 RepID=UPI0021F7BE9A|nr:CcdB family protein [Pantoea dispersa]MCW0323486.1 Toxin CcdB [Pantoea dispersa]MCW0328222.1 Toxin CcdB [Pantoea dispersa]MCW0434579.1 Toxin CcdB [Pantoea dispersa]